MGRQALAEDAFAAGWWCGLAGCGELREIDARAKRPPGGADETRRQHPGAAGSAVGAEQWEHLRDRRQVTRAEVHADHHPEGDEDRQRGGQARQDAADDRSGCDPEGDGEERVGDGNDALDVERIEAGGQGVLGVPPPADEGGEGGAPDGGGEKGPADVGAYPAPAAHPLGPSEVVRALLELLGQQRSTPEEPEEKGRGHGEVDQIDDGAIAPEQEAAEIPAALRGRTTRERRAVVVRHGDAGDDQDDAECRQGRHGQVGLVAVQTPDEVVHGATSR